MIEDKNLSKSVQTKFYLGQNRANEDGSGVLTKQAITSLSTGLTSIQNAFNRVKAYTNNTAMIQRAVIAARVVGKKESLIEKPNVAPIQPSGDQITSLFPELSKGLEKLQKSLEKLDLGQAGQQSQMAPSRGSGILGKLAAGAAIGAAGYGMYSMLSSDEAQAATPPPEPEAEPPKPSEIVKEVESKAADRKSDSQTSGAVQAQKAATQDQDTERLAKSAEKIASVTRTAAPTAVSDQTSSFSDFIGRTVGDVNKRVASFQSGGSGGGSFGGQEGGEGGSDGGVSPSNAAEFIAFYEGFIDKARDIGDGHQTIGFGHVIQPKEIKQGFIDVGGGGKVPVSGSSGQGTPINKEQAISLLQTADLPKYKSFAQKAIGSSAFGKLNEGQQTSVLSYTYNAGQGGMSRLGKLGLVDAINAGNAQLGADVIRSKGVKLTGTKFERGLTKRRYAEADLFASGKMPGGTSSGQTTGTIQRSGGAVQGMGFETAAAATRQAGIKGTNGNLDSGQLASIGVGSFVAQPQAAQAFKAMRAAAAKEGINIGVVSAYRSYQRQVELKKQKGKMAATPGRSNHGWGLAFDIPGLAEGNKTYKWMKANAQRFGIFGPLASPKEIWHWEYRGGGSLRPATVPVTSAAEQQQDISPRLRTPAGMTMNNAAASTPKESCNCDDPIIIPIPIGGGGASPTDYLKGVKPTDAARKYNMNTSEDYKVYFNAA